MFKLFNKRRRNKIIRILKKTNEYIVTHLEILSGKLKRRALILKLKKGDIILAKPGILSLSPIALLYRIFLHSKYVHSMLYIGNSNIIHTTMKNGVTIHRVPRKIYKRNRYTIYRVNDINSAQRDQIVNEALKLMDMKIDMFGLIVNIPKNLLGIRRPLSKIEKNRIWCSKLIYQAYSAIGIKLVPENRSDIITSEDLSKSTLLSEL